MSPFERRLEQAYEAGDVTSCLVLLRSAELVLPLPDAGAPAWATVQANGSTWLLAYTSVEGMRAAARSRRFRVATLVELAAGWPDQRWRLAVNPGLRVHVELESGTVARLAVPGLAENEAAYPDSLPPVMQKVLAAREVAEHLGLGRRRVSGYVHQLLDVGSAVPAAELLAALGETRDLLSPSGSVTVLRWTAVGPPLYRTPYGGTDSERMAAVSGWVVEEPPFPGLGLGRNADRVVREYKVDGAGLPHGAELWEVAAGGEEHRRAVLDAARGAWLPTGAARWRDGGPDRTARWWSYRACWRGAAYDVALDAEGDRLDLLLLRPVDGAAPEVPTDGAEHRVPAAECTDLAFVATACTWRGQPCVVQDERPGELLVEYTGGRRPAALALGFERIERGVYRGWVPRAGVRDLEDSRLPLGG